MPESYRRKIEILVQTTKKEPTWAAEIGSWIPVPAPSPPPKRRLRRQPPPTSTTQAQECDKNQRMKGNITLPMKGVPETVRKEIADRNHETLAARLHATIDADPQTDSKPKLPAISKTKYAIQITPNQVKTLRELKWETAFAGLAAWKQEYGIAIHGMPKDEVEELDDVK